MGLANGLRWVLPLALAAVGFAFRAAGHATVFAGNRVVPTVGDGWYHLRRSTYDALRFPELLGFDPFVQFPNGASAAWPPLFDAVVAWVVLALAGAAGPELTRLAMWAPPVIGALTVAGLYLLLQRRLGVWAALAAAGLLAILPAHVEVTRVGALSQRCAGGLVAVLVLAGVLRLVERDLRSWGAALATGLLLGLGVLLSTGGVLVAVVVQIGLLILLGTRPAAQAEAAALRVLVAQGVALLVLLPAAALRATPESDLFTVPYPSRAHLALFAVPAGIALTWIVAWRSPLGAGRSLRLPTMFALAAAVMGGGALLAQPSLAEGANLWPALFGPASLDAALAEPPFVAASLLADLTVFGWAVPVLLLLLLWRARRGSAATLLVLGASAVFLGVAFAVPGGYSLAGVAVALAVGYAVAAAAVLAERRLPGRGGGVLVGIAVVLLASPALLRPGSADVPRVMSVAGIEVPVSRALTMAAWLKDFTRPTGNWLDAGSKPEYGVLAPWELGHLFTYVSWRPTAVDSLSAPGRVERSREFFTMSPGLSAKLASQWKSRYVVVPVGIHEALASASPVALGRALIEFDGSATEKLQWRAPPAVTRFRLLYELGDPSDPGGLRVYEHVLGARITGVTMPKRLVRASLKLRTNTGREFTWQTSRWSSSSTGFYEIYVPYASESGKQRRFIEPLSDWVLECEGERRTVAVADWKVRKGAMIAGPHFCFR